MQFFAAARTSNSFFRSWALSFVTLQLWIAAVAALARSQVIIDDNVKSRSRYAVKETHFVPRQWRKTGVPDPDHMVTLKIGMENTRFQVLEKHLYEVSDPRHVRYGQHLSAAEVDELVRPSKKALALVDEWLQEHGVLPEHRQYSSSKQWITIELPVSKIEKMLKTKYSVYKHEEGDVAVRATEWSLPQHLHKYIAAIQPTTAFFRSAPQSRSLKEVPGTIDLADVPTEASITTMDEDDINKACNFTVVTPLCLRTLYKTLNYIPQVPTLNQIGFTNYLGEVTNRSDTAIFLEKYRPEAVESAWTYNEISIAGGPVDNGTKGGGTEALLDLQTILSQVYPMNVTSYSTGGSPPFIPDINTPTNTNEPYLEWLDYVRSQESPPYVISTSYGDDEQTIPMSYAVALCQGFAELGARGVSLLFSSGDNGVGTNGTCISNDGKNTTMFLPEFPGTCPYVTSVGGTRNYPEIVAWDTGNGYVSGGGFSNYFSQPWYQAEAVPSYIKGLDGLHDGLYNAGGRAYPDIAAQGFRYAIFYNKFVRRVDGTSASCPCMSSIIALVNDAVVASGYRPLGFLNPAIYLGLGQEAFTDVTNGSVWGCDGSGFPAREGWDAASGFGTPDFEKILEYLGLGSLLGPK